MLPDRILARPNEVGKFLINDRDVMRVCGVRRAQFAAAKQRYAHGAEISGIYGVHAHQRLMAALEHLPAVNSADAGSRVVAFERQLICDSYGFDAGKRLDTVLG